MKTKLKQTDIICDICKRKKVEPVASFTYMAQGPKFISIYDNRINVMWSCETCGAVPATIKGKIYMSPLDYFEKLEGSEELRDAFNSSKTKESKNGRKM